jgi:hypothetical protein
LGEYRERRERYCWGDFNHTIIGATLEKTLSSVSSIIDATSYVLYINIILHAILYKDNRLFSSMFSMFREIIPRL